MTIHSTANSADPDLNATLLALFWSIACIAGEERVLVDKYLLSIIPQTKCIRFISRRKHGIFGTLKMCQGNVMLTIDGFRVTTSDRPTYR